MKRRAAKSDATVKHVRLHRWMLQTAAWRNLSIGGRAALIELCDLYNGSNNGELFMSARELGRRLRVRKDTAAGYLWDCEAHGFIRPRQRGAFAWKARHATTWTLTEYGYAGGVPTKDFMRWMPGTVLTDRARPGGQRESKTRARKPGQAVTKSGTAAAADRAIWHDKRDRSTNAAAPVGPEKRDTDSLPGGTVLERVAAAPRKGASGGERDPETGLWAIGSVIASLDRRLDSISGPPTNACEADHPNVAPAGNANPGPSGGLRRALP